jgi:hypothetical protein
MIMLHIVIALTSLVVSILGIVVTSQRLVRSSCGLIVATVVTGSILLVAEPAHMLHVCVSGLSYVMIATCLTYVAHRRIRSIVKYTNK